MKTTMTIDPVASRALNASTIAPQAAAVAGGPKRFGGRDVPLVQLLEQTLKCVAQLCMHWFQYWV